MEAAGEEPLGPLLAALAGEAHRQAGAARAEILREFAAAVLQARRQASRQELGGILRALKERRQAALATAKHKAALELFGRQRAMIQTRRRSQPKPDRGPEERPDLR